MSGTSEDTGTVGQVDDLVDRLALAVPGLAVGRLSAIDYLSTQRVTRHATVTVASIVTLRSVSGYRGPHGNAKGAGECVVTVGLVPVGVAWAAQRLCAVIAGPVLVMAPGDGVGEGLGQ
jgi:hypothetical protein